MSLVLAPGKQRHADIYEFKATLVYIVTYMLATKNSWKNLHSTFQVIKQLVLNSLVAALI